MHGTPYSDILQTGYRSTGLPLSGSAEQCCVTECTTAVEDQCCGAGLREANGELVLGLGKAMGTCMHCLQHSPAPTVGDPCWWLLAAMTDLLIQRSGDN
jgi:hypothetical protein